MARMGVFALYLLTAVLLFARRRQITDCDIQNLLLALLILAVAELFFTVYVKVSSTANLLGHAFKVIGYYFLYRAIYSEAVGRPFRQMRYMLGHDELTKLPNRRAFNERLDHAMREKRSGVLLLLDLDYFQNINDAFGHEFGDRLLIEVASRIRRSLPDTAYLARFSGDEFVILQEPADPESARQLGERLLNDLSRAFVIGNDRVEITASLGFVVYPQDGDSSSILLRYADMALHQAKGAGRKCLRAFERDLADTFSRRMAVEARLKHALEQGNSSFTTSPRWIFSADASLAGRHCCVGSHPNSAW